MDWEERIKFPDIFDSSGKKAIVTGGSRDWVQPWPWLCPGGADLIVVARGEEEWRPGRKG